MTGSHVVHENDEYFCPECDAPDPLWRRLIGWFGSAAVLVGVAVVSFMFGMIFTVMAFDVAQFALQDELVLAAKSIVLDVQP